MQPNTQTYPVSGVRRGARTVTAIFAVCLALTASGCSTVNHSHAMSDASGMSKEKVILQVSDADPKKWNLALNNAKNVQKDLGKDKVDIEIVAYGPGIAMLKLESKVGNRVSAAVADGVKVVACQNTMRKMKLSEGDMLGGIGYVKAGVIELMQKQQQGYAYIRP